MSKTDFSSQLYPFLHGSRPDPANLVALLRESVLAKAEDSIAVKQAFFARNSDELVHVAFDLAEVFRNGGRLFTMGNGGSSCDAAHLAVEFLHPVTAGRCALTAINLVADAAMMTAVGNDVGFAQVFARQLIAQGRAGDALIGVSTSGNSENLLAAFETAKSLRLLTIGLAGGTGGRMAQAGLDHCLTVETSSIHRVQECHVAIYHILWDLTHTLLAGDSR
jgi:D-sedoheptulose 7-phosphate isomerase